MPAIRLRYPAGHRALVAGLLTAVLTAGCASSSVAPSAVAPEPEARAHPVPDGWIPVARYGRYTLVELTPQAAQHDLLLQVIDVSMPAALPATVGEALRYVLLRSGYTLCETDPEAAALYDLPMREIAPEAVDALERYGWPGNVRELENEIGRVLAFYGESSRLERWMLSDALFRSREDPLPASLASLTLAEAQRDLEQRMIRHVLGRYGGNRSRSARALGLSRQGLLKKLKRLGMERVARGAAAGAGRPSD